VIGSGLGRRGSTVRWRTVGRIATGWLFTLPAAGAVGALAALIAHLGTVGVIIDAVVGLAFILFIFWRSRRNRVDHSNAVNVPDVAESGYAVRIGSSKVRKVPTKTGTVPPLTSVAQSAVREDKAAREAERRAAEEREAAARAARKAEKRARKQQRQQNNGDAR